MKNEKGYALLFTIFTIVFIAVIGVGLITVTANSNKTTVHERQDQSLYYIAEAGLNYVKSDLIEQIDNISIQATAYVNSLPIKERTLEAFQTKALSDLSSLFCMNQSDSDCEKYQKNYRDFEMQNYSQPIANVSSKFSCDNGEGGLICEVNLISKGYFEGQENRNRELTQKLELNILNLVNISNNPGGGTTTNPDSEKLSDFIKGFAAIASNKITIEEKGKIEGNIGSLQGNVIDKREHRHTNIVDISVYNWLDINLLLPPFPTYPKASMVPSYNLNTLGNSTVATIQSKKGIDNYNLLNLSERSYYTMDQLYVTGEHLEIRTGNQDVYLVVKSLDINGKNIKVTGNGKLHLIVENSIHLDDDVNKDGNNNQLAIYYEGTNEWKIEEDDFKVNGDIIVRNANVLVDKSIEISGNMYIDTGNITIEKAMKVNNFHLNSGNVKIKSYPNFYGTYTHLNGDMLAESGANFKGDVYLGNVNLTTKNHVEFYKNLYIKNGDVHFQNRVDVEGDFYQQNGKMTSTGYVDLKGNLYYAGTQGMYYNKFVDVKKEKLMVAPNATVTIDDSVDVKGIVVAQDILVKDGYIKYEMPAKMDDYYSKTPIPQDQIISFEPLNNYLKESPIIER